MSVIEHLEALRRVLIVSFIAWGVATFAAFFVSRPVIGFLSSQAGINHLIYLQPAGGVLIEVKVALYIGVVIAAPIVIQQVWWFVSPGLHQHERRFILPMIVATIFFFAIGVAVAGFVSFVLLMTSGFGLVLELPVVLFMLGMLRIITSRWLYKNRPYWFLGLGLLANFLTPGADLVTPLIMFVPLYLFFEGTALLLKVLKR